MLGTTNKKRVLVVQPLHPAGIAMLEARDDVEIVQCNSIDEDRIAEAARDVHAMTVRTATITRRNHGRCAGSHGRLAAWGRV